MSNQKTQNNKTKAQSMKRTAFRNRTILTIVIAFFAFLTLVPLYIVISYSFKTKKELYLGNPLALPQDPNFGNYVTAFKKLNMLQAFTNSLLYTVAAVVILALCCSAIAWVIARNGQKIYKIIYVYFIIGILIPSQALFLQIYAVGNTLGMTNLRWGLILIFVATNMSFGIFLMTSFMSTVPVEIEEAAILDGCSIYGVFFRIVLPLLKPAIATLIIMLSFNIWNDYLMSSIYLSDTKMKPLTVAIKSLFGTQVSDYSTAFASIVVSILPITILYVCLQKYFIKGLTGGAIKG